MTDSLDHNDLVLRDSPPSSREISEADVLMTGVLASRPAREPDFAAESQALRTLAQHLMDEPQSMLKTLVRLALDLCRADTVGVSLLETAPDETSFLRWVAISGALEALEQSTIPSNFSPCGTTLACNQPQLYSYPERFFTYLYHPQFPVVEGLVIPLCVNDQALGTLWIVSHHEERHFDAEDQRLMMSVGGFTAAALHSLQQRQQTAATALRQSEQFNQQILDSSDDCIKVLDLEGRLLFISQPGQALLGIEDITPFLNTSWAEFWQGADQQAAIEAISKAKVGEICTFQGYCPTLRGEPKWWDIKVSPIRGAEGQVERLLCISRDITDRKQAEAALRASEMEYRSLFESMDEGYFLADVIFDENDQPLDIFYIDANPAATRMVGQDFTGRRLSEIDPDYESYWYEIFGRVARTGKGERLEQYAEPNQKWYDFYVFKVGDEDSRRVAVVFQDITERKHREANAAFLIGITEVFSRLSTADEIMQVVGAKVGEYLKVSTCNFTDVDEARGEVTVHYGWNSPEVPSTVGTFHIMEYLSQEFVWASCAGETSVICDTQTDPRTDGPAYAALHMYAFVTVPFRRSGRWTHYIAICDARPRNWRDDEIDLIRDISNCIFPRLERARAEAALRASEAKYRSLFESMDEGFCILQLTFDEEQNPIDYRFMEVNPAFEQQTGLKNALGRTIRELVPGIEPFWIDLYGTVALTGQPRRFTDCSQVMKRWFDVNAFRIGEPHEHKVALLFNDITDRQQAEEIARRTAELDAFRLALSDALRPLADPVAVQATASRLLGEYLRVNRVVYFEVRGTDYVIERDYANGVAGLVGGYPIDSFGSKLLAEYCAGRTVCVSDVSTDAHLSPAQRSAYTAIQIGAHIGIPLVKDGEFVAGLAVHTSEPRAWTADEVALAEEVAERTWAAVDRARAEAIVAADLQATQQLRELGARLVIEGDIQTLYQAIMSVAIALTEADAGTVQIFDEAAQELVLLATQGFEQTMRERFHRVNANSHTPCGIALRNGAHSFVDFDVPQSEDPDGSMRMHVEAGYLSGQSTPLITRSGRRIGMVSTHWREHHRPSDRQLRFLDLLARQAADLIEQRQTVAEREQLLAREQAARVEADRANRIKDEFLAVLSHELRTPLNPILGWSKLLQNGKLDAAKTQQALQTIERNAKLQAELIEDLLDVSRILQGKLNLNVSLINLSSIIRAAMETVRLAAEAKSIHLEASFEPDPPLIQGDATRLQQVIWNLLSNAVKFTPAGGQVNIRLERLDSFAQITISDTGQGIEPDFLPYVFEYFRQANATTTRKFGGLGLGLAIVRHLVELHGGTVSVESLGVGRGATFTVKLPLSPIQTISTQNERSSESASTLNGIRVLVVDDEPDSRELVAFVLEQSGAEVMAATTAYEALEMLNRLKPEVLLSDIGMP
ncbi:MAG: GAF domain-containing protein, partial [Phormidium tanganyikae FI6-MK23]|nr:GAF domain-containing protein [Phormidium tanganyikae FI6-MK23]